MPSTRMIGYLQKQPRTILLALLPFLAFACASSPTETTPPAQPTVAQRSLPLTMVEQEVPLPLAESWELVTVALEQQNIPLAEVYEQEFVILTDWIPMKDYLCTTATASSVPLPCETQYRLGLQPLEQNKTLVRIRYTETCSGEHRIHLTCPNSAAERRMIEIIGDIKALAGIP